MNQKAYSADLIYTLNGKPIPNGVVEFNEAGVISHIGENSSHASIKVEHIKGFICPGFVNTHCHLELSHLKNKVAEGKQLHHFITDLQQIRAADQKEIEAAIKNADQEMVNNGIVAVGDISNSSDTFDVKTESEIHYHTFIELFGFNPSKAQAVYQSGKKLANELKQKELRNSIVPHSPYSMSAELLQLIANTKDNTPLTIHNQETESENEMFEHKSGALIKMLQNFGNPIHEWEHPNCSSIQSYLSRLPKETPLLLVHNTFSDRKDIEWAERNHSNLFWCFCPNANLYIENRLPNINAFTNADVKCTLGTDSLASNWQLSIWEEIKSIQKYYSHIDLEILLNWGCKNGAEFLGLDHLGSIAQGKKPGLVQINEGKAIRI